MENTLIPTQYPHQSQLLRRQAQAQVQDCTILDWCKWWWDAWILVSGVSPLKTIPFSMKTLEAEMSSLPATHPTFCRTAKVSHAEMEIGRHASPQLVWNSAWCVLPILWFALTPDHGKASPWPCALLSDLSVLYFSRKMTCACSS